MTRKLVALAITTLLLLGLFPATAFAAATGTASLAAASKNVFPGDRTFSLTVNNTEAPLIGKRINHVEVILPVERAGVSLPEGNPPAPAGWTATADRMGTFHSIVYTSNTGIPTGGSQGFSIPASVARPSSADRSGPFEVYLSNDGGRSTMRAPGTAADALIANVRVLEVLNDLAPTAPAGVTDSSATGGQTITYGHSVRNHALNALSTTAVLTSSDSTDGSSTKTVSIPGDPAGATAISHSVTLGPAAADRDVLYTVAASATGATGTSRTHQLTIQQAPKVSLTQLNPTRVRSGQGANYTFEVVGAKSGTPALNVTGGELKFATTTTTLKDPVSYTGGGGTANSKKLYFNEVQVSGADAAHQPAITLTGLDNNDAPFSQVASDLSQIIIDNLAPLLTINVAIPENQTAVKNGDQIDISGVISHGGDLNAKSMRVVLVPNVGAEQGVTVSLTNNADGTTSYNGSAKPTFDKAATGFVVKAEVADTASNIGGITSGSTIIDNVVPAMLNPGRTESEQSIRVTWADNLTSAVAGGCDAGAYLIDGTPGLVQTVTFQGETGQCSGTDGTGTRILVLRDAAKMDRDAEPSVTYSANLSRDAARDGAANSAATQTIETVNGIKPLEPLISAVTRNNGSEAAYPEENGGVTTYFTRFPGTGNKATEDLQVSFGRARNGYTVQVLDAANNVLHSEQLNNPAVVSASKEFTATIRIPIGATDGTYGRKLRFVANGLVSDPAPFNVTLDTVLPGMASNSKSGNDVTVKFNEIIVGGTDYASEWTARENTATGVQYYRAETVTQTDSTTRVIRFAFQNEGPYGGIDYRLKGADAQRYIDRAGNAMANTVG